MFRPSRIRCGCRNYVWEGFFLYWNQLNVPLSQTWSNTVHVSDRFSGHHQEFKTVHTVTGTCQTRHCCLLVSKQTAVSVWHMPVAVRTVFDSWRWTERPSETCRASFQNKFDTLVHLVGFTIDVLVYLHVYKRTSVTFVDHSWIVTAMRIL